MKPLTVVLVLLLVVTLAPAQSLRKTIKQGYQQYAEKNYDQAQATFESLLQKKPENIYAQYYLGAIHEARGDKQKAFKYYDDAARNPSNAKGEIKMPDGSKKKLRIVDLATYKAETLEKELGTQP